MINEWGGFVKWRSDTYKFLKSLPRTDCVLAQWVSKANKVLESISWLPDFRFNIISQGKYKDLYPKLSFEQLFVDPKAVNRGVKCSFGTVHSVKGETLEAVLFILRTKPHQSKAYPRLLDEETLSSNEELRVVYVAITRAAKKLTLAVPKEHEKAWKRKFEV
jgi:superfamily I DNA/RNA helicase